MRIALFGAHGLLGTALKSVVAAHHELSCFSHGECDITSPESIERAYEKCRPDVLMNAAGYTDVDRAEAEPEKAFLLNDTGVRNLADCARRHTIPLVHFSSDYVFDGASREGYAEDAKSSPLNVYGRSKAQGESHVLSLERFFLIRSSWLFGPGGKNFVDTILAQAHSNPDTLRVVDDQYGCPTYTFDLAQAVSRLLESREYGIYHVTNSGRSSWYELAVEVFRQLGIPQKIEAISSQQLARRASRPAYSVLSTTRTPKLRDWREALGSYLSEKQLIL